MKTKVLSHINGIVRRVRISAFFLAATVFPVIANAVDLLSVPAASSSASITAGGDSYASLISADGRYVVFTSTANNLVHRTNGAPYILSAPLKMNAFLRDRIQGTTTLISVDPTDAISSEDDSAPTAISTNGQYVLFETASRLTAARNSTNRLYTSEIYLRDVINKTTTLVSVRMTSQFNRSAQESVMTPDARYVAFESSDPNFLPGDTNNVADVFVRDLVSGKTRTANVGFSNRISCFGPEITPDGKFVVFSGSSVSGNPTQDVYVCDLANSNTFCVSTNIHRFFSGGTRCRGEIISDNGKYVAYQAFLLSGLSTTAFVFRHNNQTGSDEVVSSNSVPTGIGQTFEMTPDGRFVVFIGQTNSSTGVFLWDGQTGSTTFVSADTNGLAPANMSCELPAIDATGRYVSFRGYANGLVTNAVGNLQEHIYRRDLLNGTTELVDVGMDGNATNRTLYGDFSMSADGRYITFDSPDCDFVEQDGNKASDVFVRDLGAETTELISAHDPLLVTQTRGGEGRRSHPCVSADGHFAAFLASGTELVPSYTNRYRGVFVRDLINQSNFVASLDTNGLGNADGSATECVISGDGRYVAFTSLADNLVGDDTNHASDVFLSDLQTGTTVLVSTNGTGPGSGNGASSSPTISLDGRYVTYFSTGKNIVSLPTAAQSNLFVYDRTTRTNFVLATNGVQVAASTPDGRYVAFYGSLTSSSSLNLYLWDSQLGERILTNPPIPMSSISAVAISSNAQWIAYFQSVYSSFPSLIVVDRHTVSKTTVSAGAFGVRPNFRFSSDGRYLVYSTTASNSPPDLNKLQDVYVFDTLTKSNLLVSRSFFTGNAPFGTSDSPDISADGRYITYESDALDIVPSDNNGRTKDIFLFDRQSGSTMLLSASVYGSGAADYVSQLPTFTADGQTVAFQSWASDLTENDFNQGSDLYLLKIINPFTSTNPPPVLTGQLVLYTYPGSGGGAPYATKLTWAAVPGFGYQVQYKTNLTDAAWLPVNGSVVIEGGQAYVKDLAPDPDRRFYRIVAF